MRGAMTLGVALTLALLSAGTRPAAATTDPLPSWNDTASKRATLAFVAD